MNAPVIVFANQKGGVGKSTLCIALANYLAGRKNASVMVFDCDPQKSILKQRASDIETYKVGNPAKLPYKVSEFSLDSEQRTADLMEICRRSEGYYLFDTSAGLKDKGKLALLMHSDYIICPMQYEPKVMASTAEFVQLVINFKKWAAGKKTDLKADLILVPNRHEKKQGSLAELHLWSKFTAKLSEYGRFAPYVYKRANLELRLNTLFFTDDQYGQTEKFLHFIDNLITE